MENSKDKILDKAEILFAEKGFDGISMDELARKAKVNKAMIYYYFSSKDKLFGSLIERRINEFDLLLNSLDLDKPDTFNNIMALIYTFAIDYICEHTNIIKIIQYNTLLKPNKYKVDIIKFIRPLSDKIKINLKNKFPDHEMSYKDEITIINLVLNFVIIKDRIETEDIRKLKKEYVDTLCEISTGILVKKNK
jgi:DNA-binding transcriptional regulator YbjK